ncbi:hypothetical protein UA08_09431 [Talaromyces atroroseus]|uniref:Uncharacterized protein n=1 Tax=Talaromyces atroroseus TaxID=1441469 RepID=A0A225ALI5_TALAT|nr:hypothetical protein UA08_09431 [Talaromyces atroroseus]OKL55275.1 hypothetical protein UA08_09431 [Talaromyces atroroseus]
MYLHVSLVAIKCYFSSRSFKNPEKHKTVHTAPNGISYSTRRRIQHQTGFFTAQDSLYDTIRDAQDGVYGTRQDFLQHQTDRYQDQMGITPTSNVSANGNHTGTSIHKPFPQYCNNKCCDAFSRTGTTLKRQTDYTRFQEMQQWPPGAAAIPAKIDRVYNLLQSRQCMMLIAREYTRVQQEELSKRIGLEESRTRAIRRLTSEETKEDLGPVDVHKFADTITEALRWQSLVYAVGVPEIFLIDYDDEDTDVWGDIPLPNIESRLADATKLLRPIQVFIAIEDHYVHQWYGKLLDLLNWQRWDMYDFKKHDGSLATFTSHMTQLIESLERPVDGDFWEADSHSHTSILTHGSDASTDIVASHIRLAAGSHSIRNWYLSALI